MYAKYTYNAGISQANLLADLVALITGTTNKALLSAGCDQANTEILATYNMAGWTVHDAAAGINCIVVKAACDGDAAQYKYVAIDTNTPGQVFLGLYESWNAITHVGTNLTYLSLTTGNGQRWATAASGAFYLSVSARHCLLYGVSSAGNGTTNAPYAPSAVLEHDRGYTWCAAGQGFTPVVWSPSCVTAYSPRYKDTSGVVQVSANSGATFFIPGSASLNVNINSMSAYNGAPMASGTFGVPVAAPASLPSNSTGVFISGYSLTDLYAAYGYMSAFDEMSFSGKTRVAWPLSNQGTAYTKLLVPKG